MANVSDFLAGLLGRAGEVIFRADDEFARDQGWQVTTGRFGLSRTYRQPDFDRRRPVLPVLGPHPQGSAECEKSAGTGRITRCNPAPTARW